MFRDGVLVDAQMNNKKRMDTNMSVSAFHFSLPFQPPFDAKLNTDTDYHFSMVILLMPIHEDITKKWR